MAGLTMVVKIVAKKESVETVKTELLKIVDPTRKEDGCLEYSLFQDLENPAVFIFHESWKSEDCLAKHMSTAHFKALGEALGGKAGESIVHKLARLK